MGATHIRRRAAAAAADQPSLGREDRPELAQDPGGRAPDGQAVDVVGAVAERPVADRPLDDRRSARPGRNVAIGGSTIRATSRGRRRSAPAARRRPRRPA